MVAMAKRLTHRIVIPTFEGSIPSSHPILSVESFLGSPQLFVIHPETSVRTAFGLQGLVKDIASVFDHADLVGFCQPLQDSFRRG